MSTPEGTNPMPPLDTTGIPSAPAATRDPRTALSWSASILLHLFVILAAFLLTWAVVQDSNDIPRVIAAAPEVESHERIEPLMRSRAATTPTPIPTPETRVSTEDLSELLVSADALLAQAAELTDAGGGEDLPIPDVRFGGVRAPEARRVVFVVDASGSMIGAFSSVLSQLEDTLLALDPRQAYGILLFQRSDWIETPPPGRLQPAEHRAVGTSIAWIRSNVIPEGRSNPTAALRRAFALDPDVIFLVSTDITGSGEFEINTTELLAELDALNPRDRHGHRPVGIRCIQLLDPDPLETLKTIAGEHGGPEGYAFIDRSRIGLDPSN
ncbi:MAG: hypothetical protein MK085_08445 [Phycisphaerales bacterium]|nr:hypothetical protein [Phycisphaerales bacterium]